MKDIDNLVFDENIVGEFTISPFIHESIAFYDENNKVVGKLDWSNGCLKFEGNFDESAKIFFEKVFGLVK